MGNTSESDGDVACALERRKLSILPHSNDIVRRLVGSMALLCNAAPR